MHFVGDFQFAFRAQSGPFEAFDYIRFEILKLFFFGRPHDKLTFCVITSRQSVVEKDRDPRNNGYRRSSLHDISMNSHGWQNRLP